LNFLKIDDAYFGMPEEGIRVLPLISFMGRWMLSVPLLEHILVFLALDYINKKPRDYLKFRRNRYTVRFTRWKTVLPSLFGPL
jgi:hypothetical protein